MCLLNFVLFFRINYKCLYGEAVYVVGNIGPLGNWDLAHALKLDWTEGHNWVQKLPIVHDNTKIIEYKYIIAPDNVTLPLTNIRWEAGTNHYLNLFTASTLFVKLDDEWEYLKVKVALHYDAIKKNLDSTKRVVLYTSQGHRQELILERSFQNNPNKEEWFWEASFSVPNQISGFHYRYKIQSESGEEVWSDAGDRKFLLSKFSGDSNFDELYNIKGSTMIKSDFNLKTSLSYDAVTEDILVGTFPQDSKDINHIGDIGVKAVLNLQTFSDMKRYGTDWESLQNSYKESNIIVEHFPISDMNLVDLSRKLNEAASVLHKLLGHGKVYVHCTAGRFRSPNVIIWYLCHYRNFTPDQAMELMKSKRTKVKIMKDVISRKCEKPIKSSSSKELTRT